MKRPTKTCLQTKLRDSFIWPLKSSFRFPLPFTDLISKIQEFAGKRNWDMNAKLVTFPREEVKDSIPAKDMTKMMLDYACELEMII